MASDGPGTAEAAEFAALVREYRAKIDGASGVHSLLFACASLLPRLYAAGLELPDVEPGDDAGVERVVRSPLEDLEALLAEHDWYWEVFDPRLEAEDKIVVGSISDDLADIYLDLVNPLLAFDRGEVADAVWSWRFSLHGHCGDHLVAALRVIHWLLQDERAAQEG